MTRESLKKKVLGTLLAVVPALVTGFVSYCQAQQNTEAIEEKAEAGYQITRSAYVEIIRDVEANKTTIEILREFCMPAELPMFSISEESYEEYAEVEEETAEAPMAEETVPERRPRAERSEWPKSLDQAQQIMKK